MNTVRWCVLGLLACQAATLMLSMARHKRYIANLDAYSDMLSDETDSRLQAERKARVYKGLLADAEREVVLLKGKLKRTNPRDEHGRYVPGGGE